MATSFLTGYAELRRQIQSLRPYLSARRPIVVSGEPGTGKTTVASILLSEIAASYRRVNLAPLTPAAALSAIFDHGASETPVLFHGLDLCDPGIHAEVLHRLESPDTATGSWIFELAGSYASLGAHNGGMSPLFVRLAEFAVEIPPLRDRPADLRPLSHELVERVSRDLVIPAKELAPGATAIFEGHRFAGNVRELRAILSRCVLSSPGAVVDHKTCSAVMTEWSRLIPQGNNGHDPVAANLEAGRIHFPPVLPGLKELRTQLIEEALRRSDGNQSEAARMLGVTPSAINKYLLNS